MHHTLRFSQVLKIQPAEEMKDHLSCRQILNLMIILGCMLNYMLRVNFTLAIVEMVKDTNQTAVAYSNLTSTVYSTQKLDWTVYQKNQALGSFYWGYIITQLPGGRLSELIGGRIVFGGGLLVISILTILTPISCAHSFSVVVLLRALIGLFSGTTFPAVPPVAVKWIPPLERSKFMSNIIASALGAAVTMPVCGLVIKNWGWQSVFYVTGGIGLIFSFAWFYLVYDSPAQHPRISIKERHEIESVMPYSQDDTKAPDKIPWKGIVLSPPVWANVIAIGCVTFALHTMLNQLPTYMKDVLHYDIQANGILSSIPYLAKYAMAVLAGYAADRILASQKYSTLAVRKCFTIISMFIPALLMAIQAFFGYIPLVSIAMFTTSLFFTGAVTGGPLSNGLDIAPNFSGTILGIGNTLATSGGWFSTFMVAAITSESREFVQWKYIFWILTAVYALGGVIFLIFASASVQTWNWVNADKTKVEKESNVVI